MRTPTSPDFWLWRGRMGGAWAIPNTLAIANLAAQRQWIDLITPAFVTLGVMLLVALLLWMRGRPRLPARSFALGTIAAYGLWY